MDAEKVAAVIGRLESRHEPNDLLGLRMQLAVLQHDTQNAVAYAERWARTDIFNPVAASLAVHLMADVAGRYEGPVSWV